MPAFYSARIPERDLIYDVGLHRGEDSAYYLALGYRVVGFEADPDHATHCRQRFAAEIAKRRMTVVEGAVSDASADAVRFFRHPTASVWGTVDTAWAQRRAPEGSTVLEVATVRLQDWLRRTGVPHYMKVDIEGADMVCVRALRDSGRPSFVSLESAKTGIDAAAAELDELVRLGYSEFAVVQQAKIPGRMIETVRLDGTPLRFRFEPDSSGPFGEDISGWVSRDRALARYRRIMPLYRIFESRFIETKLGRKLRGQSHRLLRRPLPGWYDTHARLSG